MEMRQLRYFLAVAEELNFTRAAELLHVSQPPVSRQIMLLEAEIGTPLFIRSKHHVQLTDAGRHFYEQARSLIAAAQAAVVSTRRVAAGQIGKLRIGMGGTSAYLLPDVLGPFRHLHPEVELILKSMNLAYHYTAVMDDEIDIGLVILPLADDELVTRSFTRLRLVVALSTTHPLAARPSLSLRSLSNENFVMVPWMQGHGFGRLVMRMCRRADFTPLIVQEAEPMESVLGMVAVGAGIAIVPELMQHLHADKVTYRPLKEPYAVADIAFAWRKDNTSTSLRAFLDCCSEKKTT